MRQAVLLHGVVALLASLAGAAAAQDRGLTAPADALTGSRWQARLEIQGLLAPAAAGLTASSASLKNAQTLRLLGDYPIDALRLGASGGLRLTGGLLINLRNTNTQAANADPVPTLPYAGIGYAGASLRGDWGFSADFGLAAAGLGLSLGNRGNTLGVGMDGGLRDLRLQPMLRLGMNLSF